MLRWLIMAGILGTFVLGAIVYIARPDVIEKQVGEVEAPIKRIIQSRKDEKMASAREQAFADWMRKYPLTADCVHPGSGLKALECKNRDDTARQGFEKLWRERLASGWEPD